MPLIAILPGDGIGPEVTAAVVRILESAGVAIDWDRHDAGVLAVEKTGQTLPQALLDSILANTVALKGPVTTPVGEGFTSVNVGLRKALELYANLRPVYNLPGVPTRFRYLPTRSITAEVTTASTQINQVPPNSMAIPSANPAQPAVASHRG